MSAKTVDRRPSFGPIEAVGLFVVVAVLSGFVDVIGRDPLIRGSVAGTVLGAVLGWLMLDRRFPLITRPLLGLGGFAIALIVAGGSPSSPVTAWNHLLTFLSIGLPADGVPGLAVVPCLVAFPVAFGASAALRRSSPAQFGASVVGGLIGVETLAGYAGEWKPGIVAAIVGTLVLFSLEARMSVSHLPVLVGSTTEVRRQYSLTRAAFQILPIAVLAFVVQSVVGHSALYDLRSLVRQSGILVEDPNPLSQVTALRNAGIETASETMRVSWDGLSPGRLRLAVLNDYDGTSWRQSSLYSLTGSKLAPDPVVGGEVDETKSATGEGDFTSLTIEVLAEDDFTALPAAGYPVRAQTDGLMRYSARDGLLVPDNDAVIGSTLTLDVWPAATLANIGDRKPGVGGDFSAAGDLQECVDSSAVRTVANTFQSQYPNPVERASALLVWLKLKRVFVSSGSAAVGGQSLASVETFLSPDNPDAYRKGNIDSFVTAFALVARCAGLWNRVVVGYPVPDTAPEGGLSLRSTDITAWVEIPIDGLGWVAFDPVPTPAEVQAQLESLSLPEPEPVPPPPPPADRVPVAPVVPSVESAGVDAATVVAIVTVIVVLLLLAWMVGVPAYVKRRRRRAQSPSIAVLAAWSHASENLLDRGVPLSRSHTPSDVVRVTAGRVPGSTVAALAALAPLVDTARFAGELVTSEDAGIAWGHAAHAVAGMPRRLWVTRSTLTHPVAWRQRLRAARAIQQGSVTWRPPGDIELGIEYEAIADGIPGVAITSRIGDGSTGTVYRGVINETSIPVAVKVFRFGPGDEGFSAERFEWERKVAAMVSGRPHLPYVHDSGFTSPGQRPYIVSSLYERGTLLDRVRRDGPLSPTEGVAFAVDISLALEVLHQMGVVHADLKPENVFVSGEGWVLGDLGAAWLRTARGPAASLTPPYAAPEVWRGSSPTVSTDLYSLALTLLFAVTGQVPIAGNPPDVGLVRSLFPHRHVLVEALDSDPRRRPTGAREFAVGLLDAEAAGAVDAFAGLSLPTPTIIRHR